MLAATSHEVERYTPGQFDGQKGAPVYLIEVPSDERRRALGGAISAKGLRFHRPAEFFHAAREWVEQQIDEDTAGLQDLTELMALLELGRRAPECGKGLGAADQHDIRRMPDTTAWSKWDQLFSRKSPRYARMVADNWAYLAQAPTIAARLFVRGWANVAAPFEVDADGAISARSLAQIPEDHRIAIWFKIVDLLSQCVEMPDRTDTHGQAQN